MYSKELGVLNTPTHLSHFHPKFLSLDETLILYAVQCSKHVYIARGSTFVTVHHLWLIRQEIAAKIHRTAMQS